MTAYTATLINAIVLIVLSGWAYLSSQTSVTALIPAFFGIGLLCLVPGIKADRKVALYLALFLTALIIVALIRPLSTTIQAGKVIGALRTGGMLLASLGALIIDIKAVIGQRSKRDP